MWNSYILAITWLLVNAAVNAETSNGCPSRDLSVTADDYMSLFIDGQEIADLTNADNWRYPDTLDLPCTTRVIAIEANDTGGEGGIRASTVDGYIKTNSSWKCTNKRIPGWQGFGFNDSSWMKAVVVPNFESLPEATKNSFRKDAMWIWTRGYEGQDLNVFCRFKLGKSALAVIAVIANVQRSRDSVPENSFLVTVYSMNALHSNG